MTNKLIRDGKVAVLISSGFGAGWYTWNSDRDEVGESCLFDPDIAALVESGASSEKIEELAKQKWGKFFYTGGVDGLEIKWLPVGTQFIVEEHDGFESLRLRDGEGLDHRLTAV